MVCLRTEELPLKPLTFHGEVPADLVQVPLPFYNDLTFKGLITQLARVVARVQLPCDCGYLVLIEVLRYVPVLFPGVADYAQFL